MNRVERLFAINEMIRQSGRQPIAASRLASRFGVSRRTIERDLASLRESGVPLVSLSGRSGGTLTLDQAGSTVVTLSSVQIAALLVAVAASGGDAPYSDDARAASDLLLASVADSTRADCASLRDSIRTPVGQPSVRSRIRRTCEEAVRRGRVMNISYLDAADNRTRRSVQPVGFYQGSDGWYLIAFCELRRAGRIFRLDRMKSAHTTRRSVDDHDLDALLGWTPAEVVAP